MAGYLRMQQLLLFYLRQVVRYLFLFVQFGDTTTNKVNYFGILLLLSILLTILQPNRTLYLSDFF